MYKFLHSYYHPEGHPIARILNSYEIKFWEFLQNCWNIPGLEPVIEFFRSEDYTTEAITWSWETKEKYDEWITVAGSKWSSALVLGEIYSDSVGVTQTHNLPDYNVEPAADMIATTVEDVMLDYGKSQITQ